MHGGPTSFTVSDKDWAKTLSEEVKELRKYVYHLVSLLPVKDRVPPDDDEESEPTVVSVGAAVEQDALTAMSEENRKLKRQLGDAKRALPKVNDAAWDSGVHSASGGHGA